MATIPAAYVRDHRQRFLSELTTLLRFRSVSADPDAAPQVRHCAEWLAAHLAEVGMARVRLLRSGGPPAIVAEWRRAPARPTALVYGHYDVQPPGPDAAWRSPPFDPTIRGERLYARGAADDKGQLFAHLKALESYLRGAGALPINVVCLVEGEEEIGSPHLERLLRMHRQDLRTDVAVVSDTTMPAPGRPALTVSLRGVVALEVTVRGHRADLHAGLFGGAVIDPLQVLVGILARLQDAHGRIAVPGFYDDVRPRSPAERLLMRGAGPSDECVLEAAGAVAGWGEPGYSLYERTTIRPALTITGLQGGYQGRGPKAVLPAEASAKLDIRLAAGQDPRRIEALVRRLVRRLAPASVCVDVRTLASAHPAGTSAGHPAARAAARALGAAFGRPPVPLRSGGTIPVVDLLERVLGVPTVLMGFALPDGNLHGPDENLHLPTFDRALQACVHLWTELSRAGAALSHGDRHDHRLPLPCGQG